MKNCYFFLFIVCFVFKSSANNLLKVTIVDQAKAAEFNKKYKLVIPVQDFKHMFNLRPSDSLEALKLDTSHIYITDVYCDQLNVLKVPRTSHGHGFNAVWMQPVNYGRDGFMYVDNNRLINYKYATGIYKSYAIDTFYQYIDLHSVINEGDSVFYYSTTNDKIKKINGRDTMITDFNFYEWNMNEKMTRFLFSASEIVPDSLLNPDLFEASDNVLYSSLDIYHWNWMEKTEPGKLLLNFAYCGFMQVDMNTRKIDWYWGNNGRSFSKITGLGDLDDPYYTHCINKIESGPLAGAYSYFENGGYINRDNKCQNPARSRIFRIHEADNSVEIIGEKRFDSCVDNTLDIPSLALGSVNVIGEYKLVNLGMTIPLPVIMQIKAKYGMDSAVAYWKKWVHPKVYLYDLAGHEIARYTFPYGQYSYAAWIKDRVNDSASGKNVFTSFVKGNEPTIFPNPVDDELHLSTVVDEIEIVDSDGDFMSKAYSTDKIYTGDFYKGVYYITLIKGNLKVVKKFIKK